jgi:hypothetical protein
MTIQNKHGKCTGCLALGVHPARFCPVCSENGNDYEVALWRWLRRQGKLSEHAPQSEPERTAP